MSDNAPAPIQGTAPLSTSIDPTPAGGPAGNGGNIADTKEPAKPESVGDTLRGELERVRAEEAKEQAPKVEEKPKDESDKKPSEEERPKEAKAKPEKVEEQPAKGDKRAAPEKDDAAGQGGDERLSQSEGRKHSEPPARFLPEAREKWGNVPNEVKAEFHRVSQEYEQESAQYREGHDNWQRLAKFDQMAKQHNTSVGDALERYTALDAALTTGSVEQKLHALREILQVAGVTPEQYANHVLKNPQVHQPRQPATPDPIQAVTPQISALKAEVEALRSERATEKVAPIIQAFAAKHADYHTLEPKMVEIIGSGVIEKIYGAGLSPEQKLTEAYRMAGGTASPSRSDAPPEPAHSAPVNDRPVDPAGQKSIRGAPTGGQEPDNDAPETDIRALLRKEMRKAV